MEAAPLSDDEGKPGYFGLDDSDMDEWLESSSAGSIRALALPRGPAVSTVLTATLWRGPREGQDGDACRLVSPNRFASHTSACHYPCDSAC
jgi:hypothetical protein